MKIPKGYRKLRKGTLIKEGDMFYVPFFEAWFKSVMSDVRVGQFFLPDFIFIRKIKKK